MADVFISYKSERRSAARYLSKILAQHGYSAWYDYGLVPGEDFEPRILAELGAAKACVVLWCSLAAESQWVAKEAREARRLGAYLPCLIEVSPLPAEFAAADTINLAHWDGAPRSHLLDRLLVDIGRRVGRSPASNFEGLKDLDEDWRTLGAPSLAQFALGAPAAGRIEILREPENAPAPITPEPEPAPATAPDSKAEPDLRPHEAHPPHVSPPQQFHPRGTVVICPGRGEFIEKYFEVVGELQTRGFNTFCIDWRGQGLSARELMNPLKSHFETFDDPVGDLFGLLRTLERRLPRPLIALSHSMGGAIALRALQARPVSFDAAVFVSPMWGLPGVGDAAKGYARMMRSAGASGRFAPGAEQKAKAGAFERNPFTHDRERYARTMALAAEEPSLAVAGPTIGWLAGAIDVLEGFQAPNALAHVRLPCLVVAADQDSIVDNRAALWLAADLPNCQVIKLAGAKHEILMETDDIRARFWNVFDEFAAQVAPVKELGSGS